MMPDNRRAPHVAIGRTFFPRQKRSAQKCTDNGSMNCARFASQRSNTFDLRERMSIPSAHSGERHSGRPATGEEGEDVDHSCVDPSYRLPRTGGGADVPHVVRPLLLVRRRCVDLLKVATCLCRG
jgi:hypothetical protein